MNKLIPFTKFVKKTNKQPFSSNTSVVVDKNGIPLGFVFGRDSFISFLESIDAQFEEKVKDPKKAFDNPAGKLIDMIEEKLTINPDFAKELKKILKNRKKTDWIPIEEVMNVLHV